MYIKNKTIISQRFKTLNVEKLMKTDTLNILSTDLQNKADFMEHTSPPNVQLAVLEGDLVFHINGAPFHLKGQKHCSFPEDVPHWVKARENSKFLIIR